MKAFLRTPASHRRVGAGLPLSLSLLVAAPAVAQQGAATGQDSAQVEAQKAACTKLQAYGKQFAVDSVRGLWKAGALINTRNSRPNQMQVRVPELRLPKAAMPDSMRAIAATAGDSCQALPARQEMVSLVQATMSMPRAVIGVRLQPLEAKDTAGLGLPNLKGVVVQEVVPNSGAAGAGIVKGDVIIGLNGNPVPSPNHFVQQSATWSEGQIVNVELVRQGGKRETMDVTAKVLQ